MSGPEYSPQDDQPIDRQAWEKWDAKRKCIVCRFPLDQTLESIACPNCEQALARQLSRMSGNGPWDKVSNVARQSWQRAAKEALTALGIVRDQSSK